MQNPQQLHNVSETLKEHSQTKQEEDNAEQSAKLKKLSHLAEETQKATEEYAERASNWLQENYGKTVGALGFLAAAGAIGYFIGKNHTRSHNGSSQSRNQT